MLAAKVLAYAVAGIVVSLVTTTTVLIVGNILLSSRGDELLNLAHDHGRRLAKRARSRDPWRAQRLPRRARTQPDGRRRRRADHRLRRRSAAAAESAGNRPLRATPGLPNSILDGFTQPA